MKKLQNELNEILKLTKSNDAKLYRRLIEEEFKEFMNETEKSPNQYKELCDLLWVIIQFANIQGYDLEKGINLLKDEFMSKFYTKDGEYQPLYRADGKLLKNTGFKKANFNL